MSERRAEEMLKGLGDLPVPLEPREAVEARRARIVPRLEASLREVGRERARGRVRARAMGALLAAALLALAVGVGWKLSRSQSAPPIAEQAPAARVAFASGAVFRVHDGAAAVVAGDVRVELDDEVTTAPDARARMVLARGAMVDLAAATTVKIGSDRLALGVGQLSVQVPKLAEGESFRVTTPDAVVAVHGAAFLIAVGESQDEKPRTHVAVSDGEVTVLYAGVETRVAAGEEWPARPVVAREPSTTEPAPPDAVPAPKPSAPAPSAPSSSGTSLRATTSASVDKPASTLAEQNALYRSALDARRRGDNAGAVGLLNELVSKYPRTPFGQEAQVERFRALERMGQHGAAVAEARRYLAAYPSGFAREEAKMLALH